MENDINFIRWVVAVMFLTFSIINFTESRIHSKQMDTLNRLESKIDSLEKTVNKED